MALQTPITHKLNSDKNRFEFELENGKMGIVKYIPLGRKMQLIHTEVPEELRGQGYGTEMIEQTLASIDEMRFKVIPECPFVSAYMDSHPEWDHLRYVTDTPR